jgi:CRP/FNR family transcriptional regulator, dissimilatory nitrate respiration regulator
MEQKHTLHDVPLFTKLSPGELKLVTGISKTRRFKKNQIVFLEGESYSGFYVLLGGAVKVYRLKGDGEEILLSSLGPYRSFAESSLFSGSRFYPSCAQAVEDSTALYFPGDEFAALLGRNPALAIRISEASAMRLSDLDRRLGTLSTSVEGKLARYLLNEVQLNNSIRMPEPYFNLMIHKKDLAAYLGMASETLSRTFRKFKDDRVIREVSKKVFVTNVRKLRSLAGS